MRHTENYLDFYDHKDFLYTLEPVSSRTPWNDHKENDADVNIYYLLHVENVKYRDKTAVIISNAMYCSIVIVFALIWRDSIVVNVTKEHTICYIFPYLNVQKKNIIVSTNIDLPFCAIKEVL